MPDASKSIVRSRRLVQGGTVIAALLILASTFAIAVLRLDAVSDTEAENHRLGVVLAEQTTRTFQAVDLVLQEIRDKVVSSGINDVDELGKSFGTDIVHEALARRLVDLPQAEAFVVVDATGHIVNEFRDRPRPTYTLTNQPYFVYFTQTADPNPYISEPKQSVTTGTDVIFLARRLTAPNGGFLGVVVAPIKLQHFALFFEKTGFSDGTGVTILRNDGIVLVRFPAHGVSPGIRLSQAVKWYGIVAAGGGHYRSPGAFATASPSFISVHPLNLYPIVVDVVRSEAAALARWWQQAFLIGAGALLTALFLTLLMRALTSQIKIIAGAQAQIHDQVSALTAGRILLETTLEHMDQGLLMVDAAGKIAVCNRRAAEVLGIPADRMVASLAVIDIVQQGDAVASQQRPCDVSELLSGKAVYEHRRSDGTVFEARTTQLPDGGWVRTYTDITTRAATEELLSVAASRDSLTGLANRNGYYARLDAALAAAQRDHGELVVLCLDLDKFKAVNDTLGHDAGDKLLVMVAQKMRDVARSTDVLGRMGGDEFAILVPKADLAGAARLCQRLLEVIRTPCLIAGETVQVGCSIGVAAYPADGETAEALLRNADRALYKAKAAGRNTWCAYASGDGEREHERRKLQMDIGSAIKSKQFTLAYQPICEAATGRPVAYEALLRWNHAKRGQISPAEFIPVAEETGLIIPLGRWVIETACAEAAAWAAPLSVAVNLSPIQFRDHDLVSFIRDTLVRTGLEPSRLDLEVTEGLLLDDTDETVNTMQALRAMGIRMVLDDFGTANANLSYLRGFPFDSVKIDRSFLRALSSDRQALGLVEAILAMAQALKLDVVGEGVETQEQLALLSRLQCRWVQGYLLGYPASDGETREAIWKLAMNSAQNERQGQAALPGTAVPS